MFSFYSSFRFSPPSVGFAALNNSASLLDPGPIPTSSGGEATVSVSGLGGAEATSAARGEEASTAGSSQVKWWMAILPGMAVAALVQKGVW